MDASRREWLTRRIESEDYWFHAIDLGDGLVTPGWSYAEAEKLPYYVLPDDMSGMRVLDIGCAEGFFSFEAKKRGAADVVAIDGWPECIRRFNICRDALESKVSAHEASVYDLDPRAFGTFDLVMFFGVLYHLRHPLLALQRIAMVATGTVLLQTLSFEVESIRHEPVARFRPNGVMSGPRDQPTHDPTVFWIPNGACIHDMLLHTGFVKIERLGEHSYRVPSAPKASPRSLVRKVTGRKASSGDRGWVFQKGGPGVTSAAYRAEVPVPSPGSRPDSLAAGIDGLFGGAGGFGAIL